MDKRLNDAEVKEVRKALQSLMEVYEWLYEQNFGVSITNSFVWLRANRALTILEGGSRDDIREGSLNDQASSANEGRGKRSSDRAA